MTRTVLNALAVAALRARARASRLAERLAARERETHLLAESPDPDTILERVVSKVKPPLGVKPSTNGSSIEGDASKARRRTKVGA